MNVHANVTALTKGRATRLAWLACALALVALCTSTREVHAARGAGKRNNHPNSDPFTYETFEHEKYNWNLRRNLMRLPNAEALHSPAVVLKDKRVVEYVYDSDENIRQYETIHKIIRVNTDEAVQQYNKVYIPVADVNTVLMLKARFVGPNGRVVEVNENNIKELENPQNAGMFKIFAIEGVEKGGEIEYMYTLERSPRFFGRETFQTKHAAANVEFEIITPANLVFEAKSYNGFPQLYVLEGRYPGKNSLFIRVAQLPGLPEEQYSFYQPNLMRVDYKLAYNRLINDNKMLTWNDAAASVRRTVYQADELEEADLSAVSEALAEALQGIDITDNEAKVIAIEQFIKQGIRQEEGALIHHEGLGEVLRKRYGGSLEITRLFALMFLLADINHEVVLTTDRTQSKFDGDFESWFSLEKYLFYFPGTDSYLAPNHREYRYGHIPYHFLGNEALFVNIFEGGTESEALAEVRRLPADSHTFTTDASTIDLHFDPQHESLAAQVSRTFTGHYSAPLRFVNRYYKSAVSHDIFAEILRQPDPNGRIQRLNVYENDSPYNNNDTLRLVANMHMPSVVEYAGNKYLLHLGMLIGKQKPLAKAQQRTTNVEYEYARTISHEVRFHIPAGYRVGNLDAFHKNQQLTQNGEAIAGFTAAYQWQGNTLVIKTEEFYGKATYAKAQAQAIADIMKAAGEFNQAVLLLQKEN